MNAQSDSQVRYRTAGDRGLLVEYGDRIDPHINARVRAMDMVLADDPVTGVREVIPTYRSLLVIYDPLKTGPQKLARALEAREARLAEITLPEPETIEIPVCYGGEYGPDIEHVAQVHGLRVADVIRIHSETVYRIYMIGFTPGFPFLGGLLEALHTPRLETPRLVVPTGSVGIANNQTGIYPVASPGGWQLIGRTPLTLFRPSRDNPFIYKTGDNIRFVPVSEAQYASLVRAEALP